MAERVKRRPGFFAERLGDARMLRHPVDAHVEGEVDLRIACQTRDRGCIAKMRCGGQRNVTLAGQQARGRIEPDPSRSRQIDFGPGMQIGKIMVGAGRPVERYQVRLELNQVAGDEAGGKAQVPQRLHQKPAGVAARPFTGLEGFLGRLYARLHADDIADLIGKPGIEADDEIHGARLFARHRFEKSRQARTGGLGRPVDDQVRLDVLGIGERPGFGRFLDKEVERIVDRHVGDQIHLDLQFHHRIGKHIARQPVSIGILLVIDEMFLGTDLERVRYHPCPTVRRRTETDDLRAEAHRAIILVMGQMVYACQNRHGVYPLIGLPCGNVHHALPVRPCPPPVMPCT